MVHLILFLLITTLSSTSSTTTDSFIFGGCSRAKFLPDSIYENSVNSILTSLINSAALTNYSNFTVPGTSSSVVYGLFQCRGDLKNDECSECVTRAVSQLGTLCFGSSGGALQLEGCFVKYDNATFVGVEDKTEVMKKCGPSIGLTDDALSRRDGSLAYLLQQQQQQTSGFRITSTGDFHGVSQCTGDLSWSECHDCVSDAIQRLKTECGASTWAQVYLANCYARYRYSHDDDDNHNDDEIEKTLAILIGLIAGVALIIVFLSFLSKVCEKQTGAK